MAASEPAAAAYQAVGPTRLADTRTTSAAGFERINAATIRVHVDATRASAAVLVVTAVNATGPGFVTVYPTGSPRPDASNLNMSAAGEVRANTVTVQLSAGGSVDLYASTTTSLLVDLVGLFHPSGAVAAGRFVSMPPARILDSRQPAGAALGLPAGQVRVVPLPVGVPTDTTALAVNLTFTATKAPGFFSAWPAGTARPNASVGNADQPGQTRAIFAVVPASASGINLYSQSGAHVIVDLVGYFSGPSAAVTDIGLFRPSLPDRLLDTRRDRPGFLWPNGTAERAGLPGATAAWLNITSVDALVPGYITAWPARTPRPNTSTVNAIGPGTAVANAAIVNLSTEGFALASFGGEHVLADLAGTFIGNPVAAELPPAANEPPSSLTFGTSVGGRALVVHHKPSTAPTKRSVLVLGSMHGEEPAGQRVTTALRSASLPADMELWTIDSLNPDGLWVGQRQNLRGVDLNRNWAGARYPWVRTTGAFSSGSAPLSEPETQALSRLLGYITSYRPLTWGIGYHQPLYTVDCDPALGARLMAACDGFAGVAKTPQDPFIIVPGSLTDTMNGLGRGLWFTVEFGAALPTAADVARHVAAIIALPAA